MAREQLWVIGYNTPSDKRRRKLAKLLQGYGVLVQWSVFECRATECGSGRCRSVQWRPSRGGGPTWQDKVI
jgi:CRISPR/Cas system-associated endoribonuclease Cas2